MMLGSEAPQLTATHCNILYHTATYCNTPQHTATCCTKKTGSLLYTEVYGDGGVAASNVGFRFILQCHVHDLCPALCCSVLQCVAVCCSVLQCVAVCCSECGVLLQCLVHDLCPALRCSVLQCVAVCYSVLQCVVVCCSVLPFVAVRCSVCCSVR